MGTLPGLEAEVSRNCQPLTIQFMSCCNCNTELFFCVFLFMCMLSFKGGGVLLGYHFRWHNRMVTGGQVVVLVSWIR